MKNNLVFTSLAGETKEDTEAKLREFIYNTSNSKSTGNWTSETFIDMDDLTKTKTGRSLQDFCTGVMVYWRGHTR